MKWLDFLEKLNLALYSNTVYAYGGFGFPLNESNKTRLLNNKKNANEKRIRDGIKGGNKNTFAFDCVCLPKGILWGWNGDPNRIYGGADYNSKGVPDINSDVMTSAKHLVSMSTDFSKIEVGAFVGMEGHMGIYIGNGDVIECTPKWNGGVQKRKLTDRKWLRHGRSIYIDYSDTQTDDIANLDIGDIVYIQGALFTSSTTSEVGRVVHGKTKVKVDILARGKRNPIHVTGNGASGWANSSKIVGNEDNSFKPYKTFLKEGTILYDDQFVKYALPIKRERTVEIVAEKNGFARFNDKTLKGTDHAWIKLTIDKPRPKPLGVGSNVILNGYAYTKANRGSRGSVNHKDKKGVIDIVAKGDKPYHVKGIGWVTASQLKTV